MYTVWSNNLTVWSKFLTVWLKSLRCESILYGVIKNLRVWSKIWRCDQNLDGVWSRHCWCDQTSICWKLSDHTVWCDDFTCFFLMSERHHHHPMTMSLFVLAETTNRRECVVVHFSSVLLHSPFLRVSSLFLSPPPLFCRSSLLSLLSLLSLPSSDLSPLTLLLLSSRLSYPLLSIFSPLPLPVFSLPFLHFFPPLPPFCPFQTPSSSRDKHSERERKALREREIWDSERERDMWARLYGIKVPCWLLNWNRRGVSALNPLFRKGQPRIICIGVRWL